MFLSNKHICLTLIIHSHIKYKSSVLFRHIPTRNTPYTLHLNEITCQVQYLNFSSTTPRSYLVTSLQQMLHSHVHLNETTSPVQLHVTAFRERSHMLKVQMSYFSTTNERIWVEHVTYSHILIFKVKGTFEI